MCLKSYEMNGINMTLVAIKKWKFNVFLLK